MLNILVLCTGNSARSILLEAILNAQSGGAVKAYSAGSQPAGAVHPQSLILLSREGYDVSEARSKSWDAFAVADAPKMDAVITVCASAAGETCPYWPGSPVTAHWGVDDPAAATEENWDSAFNTAYAILKRRAEAFLAQPVETMDSAALKAALDAAGAVE